MAVRNRVPFLLLGAAGWLLGPSLACHLCERVSRPQREWTAGIYPAVGCERGKGTAREANPDFHERLDQEGASPFGLVGPRQPLEVAMD